eukprot:5949630-Lingulodinium_polyedra.AAC.1
MGYMEYAEYMEHTEYVEYMEHMEWMKSIQRVNQMTWIEIISQSKLDRECRYHVTDAAMAPEPRQQTRRAHTSARA